MPADVIEEWQHVGPRAVRADEAESLVVSGVRAFLKLYGAS
ncbi:MULTISPECIES: hypothetical protein [unclassified Streptomyces]|nr:MULTISPECIES: hypothetical protein [unclassified Streptomyces]